MRPFLTMSTHALWLVGVLLVGTSNSQASEPIDHARSVTQAQTEFAKPLGIDNFQLDHKTRMTGWRLTNSWYLGRQKGLDSGLTLVWQKSQDQLSFSKNGLRFTRRF